MRNLKPILILAITAGIATWFMPWWMIAVFAFVVSVSHKLKPKDGFISGFSGIGLMWLAVALFRDIPNEHILSARMAGLLGLPNYALFILITVLLGALIGGLSGWSGGWMNKAFRK
jgi:hypothetical protein